MKLTDISTIKALMAEFGTVFKKKYGQNFLISERVLGEIADNADVAALEIGPGIGSLTSFLCERAEKVCAVEIDDSLIPILSRTLADYDNVEVINADAMKIDLAALCREQFGDRPVSVCANLPYYITTPVLTRLLECGVKFTNVTVMIQKEVAQRLCAKPGSPDYGAISVFVAYYGSPKKILNVPAGCFVPAPKVDSAVVRIDIHDKPPVEGDPALLFRVVRAAFGQRRKTLYNALSTGFSELGKERIAAVLAEAGVEPTVRGEKLSLEEFAAISRVIEKSINNL